MWLLIRRIGHILADREISRATNEHLFDTSKTKKALGEKMKGVTRPIEVHQHHQSDGES